MNKSPARILHTHPGSDILLKLRHLLPRGFRLIRELINVRRGFTLIELLIVIGIMGILAAAVLVAINPLKRAAQGRDAARKSDIGQIASSLQSYYVIPGNGVYPTNVSGAADVVLTGLTAAGFLKRIPTQPNGGASYSYTSSGNVTPNEAAVYASLEAPTGATGWWCWKASNGVSTEILSATQCTST